MCVHHIHITLYTSSNPSEKGANNAKSERMAARNINIPNNDNKNDDSILKAKHISSWAAAVTESNVARSAGEN